MIRRWAVLEEREGQPRAIISRHFWRTGAETAALLAADNWRNQRGEIQGGRAVWDWAGNRPVRLRTAIARIHPEMAGRGSLWPDTEFYVVQLPLDLIPEPA